MKHLISLKYGVGGDTSTDTWTTRKRNRWVLEQIKFETSLEAKIMKLKHTTRKQESLEKAVMLGKWKAAGKEADQA